MEEVRCIRCGRPLRDPVSITRGMGPECAGGTGGRRSKYRSGVRSRSGSLYAAMSHSTAYSFTVFSLTEHLEQRVALPIVEEIDDRKSRPAEVLKYPTDLVDLVLSAPAPGAIAWQVKNHSKKKKPVGALPPGRILQEIRRMCIDLRLTFFPGMFTPHGQQIACVPYGDDGWRFENSEKVMSRKDLEDYLSRYGMICLASL